MKKIILIDPKNKRKLSPKDLSKFKSFSNIYDLFIPDESNITNIQSDFYNDVKFPNYDDIEDYGTLLDKAERSIFAKLLDNEIPIGATVLEAGCGTGQLSIFLSRYNRQIYGIDISKGSLVEAKKFITKNSIKNVTLYRMNIFNHCFVENTFDVIISNGVLHHTHNPKKAFINLSRILKENGIIVIGLYHKFGRIFHNLRKIIIRKFGSNFDILDKKLRENLSSKKTYAWYKDQYENPSESLHTFTEVIKWFKENNIEYLSSIPFDFDPSEKLFSKKKLRSSFEYFIEEFLLTFNSRQIYEGGFFIVVGKKVSK
jgi:SAM-dependent methyltransferase